MQFAQKLCPSYHSVSPSLKLAICSSKVVPSSPLCLSLSVKSLLLFPFSKVNSLYFLDLVWANIMRYPSNYLFVFVFFFEYLALLIATNSTRICLAIAQYWLADINLPTTFLANLLLLLFSFVSVSHGYSKSWARQSNNAIALFFYFFFFCVDNPL